jgi:hypothetical protein
MLMACGPVAGLKEIVNHTQLTVEGTITVAESRLTTEEDNVYTDYEIDIDRVFRAPRAATRSIPGPTNQPSPFVIDAPLTRPTGTTKQRVRVRRSYHGQVTLDGGVVTATSRPAFPTLTVGQHVIVSAYFDESRGWWVPFGVFKVQDGRVLRLDERGPQTKDYDSVEEFATALANPPPTTVQLNEK